MPWSTLWDGGAGPWCPGAEADHAVVVSPGGDGPRGTGAGPPLVAQRGVLPDHGAPRAAAGAGLCIDVRVQILLHHPGRSDLGSTSGSISPSSQTTLEKGAVVFVVLHCGNSGARLLGTADEAFLKWYPQVDLHPRCQEGPSRNSLLPLWLCFAFFLTA